jgi:hypothetical protein
MIPCKHKNFLCVHPNLVPQRIKGVVQIGEESTYGDVMSGKSTWKLSYTMASLPFPTHGYSTTIPDALPRRVLLSKSSTTAFDKRRRKPGRPSQALFTKAQRHWLLGCPITATRRALAQAVERTRADTARICSSVRDAKGGSTVAGLVRNWTGRNTSLIVCRFDRSKLTDVSMLTDHALLEMVVQI